LIKTTRRTIDTSLKNLRDRIDSQQVRLNLKRQELLKLYAATDAVMSRLNSATGSLQNLTKQTF